jgi:chaperonin GroES
MASKSKATEKAVQKPVAQQGVIQPLGDRVVVLASSREEVSASGIIIPDTAKAEKPERGVVVAVGAGKWNEDGDERIPMSVKTGDIVLFSKYGYDEVKVNGKDYLILAESSILAIIND